jgi:hypothetical protein
LNPQIQPEGIAGSEPERKADKTAEEHYTQGRADTEEQEKEETPPYRWHDTDNQQGEYPTPGQTVNHSYQQGSANVSMLMTWSLIVSMTMEMTLISMPV